MIATAVTLSEVNFLTGHALFKVAKGLPLKLLWASRIVLNVLALIFLAPCTFMPAVAVPCVLASTGLYLIADAAFKSNANDEQVAEEFDFAQVSVLNFLLDVPGFVCGTYDRYLVPVLNIFAAVTLAVLYSVIVPLENAWGCYSNMDIVGLKYGTCPEFGSVAVVNGEDTGTVCSRPGLSTIDCVIQPAAFDREHTARTVAFVALGASLAVYTLSWADRKQAARIVLLNKKGGHV